MEQINDPQAQHGANGPGSSSRCVPGERLLLWMVGMALILAVSRQSLWIDEASTAASASEGSLREWWLKLTGIGGSDLQMPVYMIYMWGWVKLFGSREWVLRAAGLVWLVPGLVAMASGFSRRHERAAVMLVAVTSAFVWYYAGEARPYAMQLGASALIFAALHRLGREELSEREQSRWLSGFLLGILVLCGSSLLGVVWSAAALGGVWILIPRRRLLELWKSGWLRWVLTGVVLCVLGLYYVWTLSVGARASAVAGTHWQTVAFVFYEQFGLAGIGPGRIEMREAGVQTLRPYLPLVAWYVLLLSILAVVGVRQILRREPAKRVGALAVAVAVPAALLFGLGFASHFRVLGRHFTPMMPIWFSLLGLGLAALWGRAGWMGKALAAAYLLFSLFSCLSIDFAARHQRDDYREAAQYARNALGRGEVVWWNADLNAARYYKLPLDTEGSGNDKAILVDNSPADWLASLKSPDVIIASKPDIFDGTGALAEYLSRHHYRVSGRLAAFTIWQE